MLLDGVTPWNPERIKLFLSMQNAVDDPKNVTKKMGF